MSLSISNAKTGNLNLDPFFGMRELAKQACMIIPRMEGTSTEGVSPVRTSELPHVTITSSKGIMTRIVSPVRNLELPRLCKDVWDKIVFNIANTELVKWVKSGLAVKKTPLRDSIFRKISTEFDLLGLTDKEKKQLGELPKEKFRFFDQETRALLRLDKFIIDRNKTQFMKGIGHMESFMYSDTYPPQPGDIKDCTCSAKDYSISELYHTPWVYEYVYVRDLFGCWDSRRIEDKANHISSIDCSNLGLTRLSTSCFDYTMRMQMRRLQKIIITGNYISEFPEIHTRIYKNLTELQFANNRLSTLPDCFSELSKLKIVNLSGNDFEQFPVCLKGRNTIEELDISHNKLAGTASAELFLFSTGLRIISIAHNKIDRLPDDLCTAPSLINLDMSNNLIQVFPLTSLESINSLKTADFEGNPCMDHLTDEGKAFLEELPNNH